MVVIVVTILRIIIVTTIIVATIIVTTIMIIIILLLIIIITIVIVTTIPINPPVFLHGAACCAWPTPPGALSWRSDGAPGRSAKTPGSGAWSGRGGTEKHGENIGKNMGK